MRAARDVGIWSSPGERGLPVECYLDLDTRFSGTPDWFRNLRLSYYIGSSTECAVPGVRQACVRVRDGRLVAYVVGTCTDLRTHLRAVLPPALVPDHVVMLDALPVTVGGKVDVAALPEPVHATPALAPVAAIAVIAALTLVSLNAPLRYVFLMTEVLVAVLFATSLNLLMGYGGMLSLGHAAYYALGAYTAGILATSGWPMWAAMLLGPLVAAAGAALSGAPWISKFAQAQGAADIAV